MIHLLLGCEEGPIKSHVQLFIKALHCLLCQLQYSLNQVTACSALCTHNTHCCVFYIAGGDALLAGLQAQKMCCHHCCPAVLFAWGRVACLLKMKMLREPFLLRLIGDRMQT